MCNVAFQGEILDYGHASNELCFKMTVKCLDSKYFLYLKERVLDLTQLIPTNRKDYLSLHFLHFFLPV